MLCKGSERSSPSLLLYKRGSGWVLSLLRRCGPGLRSACRGRTWSMAGCPHGTHRALRSVTGPSSTPTRRGAAPPGVQPQSSSRHAKTRMHHRTESCAACRPVPVRNTEQSTQTASAWCPGPTAPGHSSRLPAAAIVEVKASAPQGHSPLGHGHGHYHAALAQHSLSTPSAATAAGLVPSFSLPPPFIYRAKHTAEHGSQDSRPRRTWLAVS